MKKLICIVILSLLLVIGCSTREERYDIAGNLGEVVYQRYPNRPARDDIFIIKIDDENIAIVYVSKFGSITEITKIDLNKKIKENEK